MAVVTDAQLDRIVEAIVQIARPERIYLFGSQARQEAGSESDVDLLVVEREPFGPGRSRLARLNSILEALPTRSLPADVLLYTAEEFARWRHSPNHVIGRCEREGRLLYARS
jgi:uncharacterized protein